MKKEPISILELDWVLDADLLVAFMVTCRKNKVAPGTVLGKFCEEYIQTCGQPDPNDRLIKELERNTNH